MRFLFAVVSFVLAAVLIGIGVAQRTVWLPPSSQTFSVPLDGAAKYVILPSGVLNARPGAQVVKVTGQGTVVAVYGRDAELVDWVGSDEYATVAFDTEDEALSSVTQAGAEPTNVNSADEPTSPAGNDMWLEEYTGVGSLSVILNAPLGYGLLITTGDEGGVVPTTVSISWPNDNATPLVGPLWTAGGALTLLGLIFLLLGVLHYRRARRPRRNLPPRRSLRDIVLGRKPRWPDAPVLDDEPANDPAELANESAGESQPDESQPDVSQADASNDQPAVAGEATDAESSTEPADHSDSDTSAEPADAAPRSRRRFGFGRRQSTADPGVGSRTLRRGIRVAPVAVLTAVVLAGCSADYWPRLQPAAPEATAPTATATASPQPDPASPALSTAQITRILARISEAADKADAAKDPAAAAAVFTGPALAARTAAYTIMAKVPTAKIPAVISASSPKVQLPQQATADTGWPRSLFVITQDPTDAKAAPTVLVLVQATPRSNYVVEYTSQLVANVTLPDVAPASVGAPLVPADFQGLVVAPDQVASAFADVLQNGAASQFAKQFDLASTDLDETLSSAARKADVQKKNPTLALDISITPGELQPITFGTNDAGALVSLVLMRTETSRPTDGGTTGFGDGSAARALSGFDGQSAKGVSSTRALQLLFYVPPVNSTGAIRLVAWSESLTAASEAQ